jgi:hypothetical protein
VSFLLFFDNTDIRIAAGAEAGAIRCECCECGECGEAEGRDNCGAEALATGRVVFCEVIFWGFADKRI